MTQINAYLHFQGNCREAMTFYKEALGGELTMQTVGESPIAAQMPPQAQAQIMHATLARDNFVVMASDMARSEPTVGDRISLLLDCSSEAEAHRCFEGLAAGGAIGSPLKQEFWGALFGDLTDKYGVRWMVNYSPPPTA